MTARLILLRHGQTTSNIGRYLDTEVPGAELTDEGRTQATSVGIELADYCEVAPGSLGRLSGIYSSVAIRAQQTAMGVARSIEEVAGLPHRSMRVVPKSGIHEISAGNREMRHDDESHGFYSTAMAGWLRGAPEARMPGERGENIDDILARYQPVLEEIVGSDLDGGAADRDVIVVSHGAAIRTVATHAASVDPEFAYAGYLANCRFIVLAPNNKPFGQWNLVRWSDLNHQI